ncbi:hypothetical protein [Leptotrichia alba]|uniref:Uncharacterized protein n=1 Tax=Leptotrichia alba TaxID=3239304 RepID=A0AB39V3D5_9FUSO
MKNLKKITVTFTALSGVMFSNSVFGASNSKNSDIDAKTAEKLNNQTQENKKMVTNKKRSNSKNKSSDTQKEIALKSVKSTSSDKIIGKITVRPATKNKSRNKSKKKITKFLTSKSNENFKIIKKEIKEISKNQVNLAGKKKIEAKTYEVGKDAEIKIVEESQKLANESGLENHLDYIERNEKASKAQSNVASKKKIEAKTYEVGKDAEIKIVEESQKLANESGLENHLDYIERNEKASKAQSNVASKKKIEAKTYEVGKDAEIKIVEESQKLANESGLENHLDYIERNEKALKNKKNNVKVEEPVTKEIEKKILSTATSVSTRNYSIPYIQISSIDTNNSGKLSKSNKINFSFDMGLEVKNPEIELENVKVYLVTPGRKEKLIINSKAPEGKTIRNKNEGLFETWITDVGMKSYIKNFNNEKIDNHIRWNGTSGMMGSVSFKNLVKMSSEKNEMDKKRVFGRIKNLVSSDNQYSYLFKFVIKAKDGEEELIYQPAVFNVKLMGAKKI